MIFYDLLSCKNKHDILFITIYITVILLTLSQRIANHGVVEDLNLLKSVPCSTEGLFFF